MREDIKEEGHRSPAKAKYQNEKEYDDARHFAPDDCNKAVKRGQEAVESSSSSFSSKAMKVAKAPAEVDKLQQSLDATDAGSDGEDTKKANIVTRAQDWNRIAKSTQ